MKWKKKDSQSWSRKGEDGTEHLYADEDDMHRSLSYCVRFEDNNGESVLYRSNSWKNTLAYARKEAKKTGLIKPHPSAYK